jgi:hypothetical protein
VRILRSVLITVLTFSILLWCLGLIIGNRHENHLYWEVACYALYGIGGSILLLLLTLPFGFSHAEPEPRKLKARASDLYGKGVGKGMASTGPGKCLDCGRPVVPGSDYCRYHTDLRKEERDRGRS